MALTLSAITLNSADPRRTAAFWAEALGGSWRDGGNGYLHVLGGQVLLIVQPAADRVTGPTDVHLDLKADDPGHEVARLVAVGAEIVAERADSHGSWTVLRDPDDLIAWRSSGSRSTVHDPWESARSATISAPTATSRATSWPGSSAFRSRWTSVGPVTRSAAGCTISSTCPPSTCRYPFPPSRQDPPRASAQNAAVRRGSALFRVIAERVRAMA